MESLTVTEKEEVDELWHLPLAKKNYIGGLLTPILLLHSVDRMPSCIGCSGPGDCFKFTIVHLSTEILGGVCSNSVPNRLISHFVAAINLALAECHPLETGGRVMKLVGDRLRDRPGSLQKLRNPSTCGDYYKLRYEMDEHRKFQIDIKKAEFFYLDGRCVDAFQEMTPSFASDLMLRIIIHSPYADPHGQVEKSRGGNYLHIQYHLKIIQLTTFGSGCSWENASQTSSFYRERKRLAMRFDRTDADVAFIRRAGRETSRQLFSDAYMEQLRNELEVARPSHYQQHGALDPEGRTPGNLNVLEEA